MPETHVIEGEKLLLQVVPDLYMYAHTHTQQKKMYFEKCLKYKKIVFPNNRGKDNNPHIVLMYSFH